MKINKIIFFFLIIMLFFVPYVFAGYQEINNLEYQVTLKENGSADIKEIWDIYVSETNTLFKTFEMDSSKFTDITNVTVKEITNNMNKKLTKTNTWSYHLKKDTYCGVINADRQFEIAWGVGLDNSSDTRKYEITYTVNNVVKTYNDCSEFYWMFLADTSSIYCDNVTGIIKLPKQVNEIDNLKVWAHGPLNGNIIRESEDTVTFEIERLPENTMLEARIAVLDNTIFANNPNKINRSKLQEILTEEQEWADEANRQRSAYISTVKVFIYIGAFVCIIIIYNIVRKIKASNKLIAESNLQGLDYYREIPNENMTPADVNYLIDTEIGYDFSKVFSATILHLITKKMIEFEKIIDEKGKEEIKFKLLPTETTDEYLNDSEGAIFSFLAEVNKEHEFTIEELKKYIRKRNKKVYELKEEIEESAKKEENMLGHYIDGKDYKNVKGLNIILGIMALIPSAIGLMLSVDWIVPTGVLVLAIITIITAIVLTIINLKLTSKLKTMYSGITTKGMQEKEKWEALKRYIKDFSLLNEREIPEIILWEKFLVFATVFGIAEKVIKELKIAYPEFTDNSYLGIYAMTNMRLVSSINYSITNAINTRTAEIASNNFSSGGGGGRRILKRWRRPEAAEAQWEEDNLIKQYKIKSIKRRLLKKQLP